MTATSPTVSILIPVYNREQYIAECIESALVQNYADFEIIIVDNQSNDRTWDICQDYALKDKRIRAFQNKTNIGPVRNWMRCAQEAKGRLSKFLFSDDCLEPNCLGEMVEKIDNLKVGLVCSSARVGKTRIDSKIAYSQIRSTTLNSSQFVNYILAGLAPVSPGAILIRTLDLKKNLYCQFPTSSFHDFEKNGAGPDVMISLLTSLDYAYVSYISLPLVFFRHHEESFSIMNLNNGVTDGYKAVFAFFLIKHYGRKNWINYLARIWLGSIRNYQWRSPAKILQTYEGNGSINEVMLLLRSSIALILLKLANFFPK